ncbi:MAG TPA: hypothetical protein VN752_09535 [Solirubrobacterales bacterium]|nr:hypothetical protein [Solirubrobacterales bacterium]
MSQRSIDIDELVEKLDKQVDQAKKLAKEVQEAPAPAPGESEQLIKSISENLAAMREAAGLPTKSAAHYEEQIRLKQRQSGRK